MKSLTDDAAMVTPIPTLRRKAIHHLLLDSIVPDHQVPVFLAATNLMACEVMAVTGHYLTTPASTKRTPAYAKNMGGFRNVAQVLKFTKLLGKV